MEEHLFFQIRHYRVSWTQNNLMEEAVVPNVLGMLSPTSLALVTCMDDFLQSHKFLFLQCLPGITSFPVKKWHIHTVVLIVVQQGRVATDSLLLELDSAPSKQQEHSIKNTWTLRLFCLNFFPIHLGRPWEFNITQYQNWCHSPFCISFPCFIYHFPPIKQCYIFLIGYPNCHFLLSDMKPSSFPFLVEKPFVLMHRLYIAYNVKE